MPFAARRNAVPTSALHPTRKLGATSLVNGGTAYSGALSDGSLTFNDGGVVVVFGR
jgi:hypothetical protein